MDFIDLEFMFGGFPGFEPGVIRVIEILAEYDIDPRSKGGQQLLGEFINHAEEEYYGDFERFTECSTCGKEFLPEYDFDYVFKIVSGGVTCPRCGGNPEDKPA